MYHWITYADEAYSQDTKNKMTVRFWHAVMKSGYIDYQNQVIAQFTDLSVQWKSNPLARTCRTFPV